MATKTPSIITLKARIKKALKNQGNYTESMDTLIDTTAGNYYAYCLALRDVEALDKTFVEELTREDNIKMSPHPAIKTLREQSEMVRRLLRELRLTVATVEGMSDDEMSDLVDSVNNME